MNSNIIKIAVERSIPKKSNTISSREIRPGFQEALKRINDLKKNPRLNVTNSNDSYGSWREWD